jgi:cell division transport system permease protein
VALARAVSYFFQEALTSLWRSRLINAVSIGTIAISLFVFGSFLTVASNLTSVISEWSRKIQMSFYLEDSIEERIRLSLENRLRDEPAVQDIAFVSRDDAIARFRDLFREMSTLPDDLGQNPFPASLEVTIRPGPKAPEEVERLARTYASAPGVEDVQYDLLWIQRLTIVVRLVRWVGGFLGGILVLASVFTISNVIRLTVYARQDELDIMRLVGATQSYVKGPFVVEGMLQGGLGGLTSIGLLWAAFRFFARDAVAASDLLGRSVIFLPLSLSLAIVVGGMTVGIVGSLISIGRTRV